MKNEILLNITKFKFYHVDYREYFAIYKNYVICVYPFAIHIFKIIKLSDIESLRYDVFGECFKSVFDLHHIDWKSGKKHQIDDPCRIYEKISGQIDAQSCDLSREYYHKQMDKLNVEILHSLRREKLKKLML